MLLKPNVYLCLAALNLTLPGPNVALAAEQPMRVVADPSPSPAERAERAINQFCADRFHQVGDILDAEVAYMGVHGDFSGEVVQYIANHYNKMAQTQLYRNRDVPSLSNVNPSPSQRQARSEVVRALVIQYARERAGLEPGQCDDLAKK
ncbi:hypothetical protein [Novosphingobium nitrogenifigens]|uniref:hypothetical protein n=1 Tax=Novosphingobium nitrogenifigens TaxID=378548 RepID=UPI00038176FA|nr:hypothetical protein [Novosphingobium nitrogenifigens]